MNTNATIKFPNNRSVEGKVGGFDYLRAVHRQVVSEDRGRCAIFDCVIMWRPGDTLEKWNATVNVGFHDERTCRYGVGIYVPVETFQASWQRDGQAITDPDEIALAVVQQYVDARPDGFPRPRIEDHWTYDLDDHALGETIGHAWAAGVEYAIGFAGKLVEQGSLDELAMAVIDSVPGFAVDEKSPSPRLLASVRHALYDANKSGLIKLRGQ